MSSNLRPTNLFGSYNNRLPQGKTNPTKGTGINSYQTGNTVKDVRGFWNKDYTNDMPAPFGKPRPLKHFRKGRVIPHYIEITNPSNRNEFINVDYNEMRNVKSSVLNTMVSQMLWLPGSYSIVPNVPNNLNSFQKSIYDCKNCKATTVVSNYVPINNLTETPEANIENKILCCNQEYKAKRRILSANTITKPNYYTTNYQYLQNRCQTFKQRQFNFVNGVQLTPDIIKTILSLIINNPLTIDELIKNAKPGSPLSYYNNYVAQCFCNGAILETSLNVLILELIISMNKNNLINQTEYNLLVSLQFKRLQNLIDFIGSTFDANRSKTLGEFIFYTIDNNKTLSELVENPTNSNVCGKTYYKPNNYQFSVQGGVMSSLQILKKNVDTINKNNALNKKLIGVKNAEILNNVGGLISSPFFLKAKYGVTCYNVNCGKPIPSIDPTTGIGYRY